MIIDFDHPDLEIWVYESIKFVVEMIIRETCRAIQNVLVIEFLRSSFGTLDGWLAAFAIRFTEIVLHVPGLFAIYVSAGIMFHIPMIKTFQRDRGQLCMNPVVHRALLFCAGAVPYLLLIKYPEILRRALQVVFFTPEDLFTIFSFAEVGGYLGPSPSMEPGKAFKYIGGVTGRFWAPLVSKYLAGRRLAISSTFLEHVKYCSLPLFEYSALEGPRSVRLLKLEREGEDINCEFVTVSLDNAYPYEAISHRWGNLSKSHALIIGSRQLGITEGVHNVLCSLVPMGKTRYLWIDSICINQEDRFEKDQQIQLMADIYKTANSVIACLGDSADSEMACNFIYRVAHRYFDSKIRGVGPPGEGLPFIREVSNWRAIRTLTTNQYWSRVWIIQEITVAKNVHILYGDRYIPISFLHVLFEIFHQAVGGGAEAPSFQDGSIIDQSIGLIIFTKIRNLRDPLTHEYQPKSLPDLVKTFRTSEATQPEDKVNALLGISCDSTEPSLQPNHQMTTQEVYAQVARFALSKNNFILLSIAGLNYPRSQLDLPSWVPDLTWPSFLESFGNILDYRAGGSLKAEFRIIESGRQLQIRGCLVDEIMACASDTHSTIYNTWSKKGHVLLDQNIVGDHVERVVRGLYEIHEIVEHDVPDPYIGGCCRKEALWRTLIQDNDGRNRPAKTDMGITYDKILATFGRLDEEASAEIESQMLEDLQIFMPLCAIFYSRKFAITQMGYMALVPPGAEPGDKLCVFLGAPVAYLLRANEGQDTYDLWGDAYIHGFMDGEALKGVKSWFTLQ